MWFGLFSVTLDDLLDKRKGVGWKVVQFDSDWFRSSIWSFIALENLQHLRDNCLALIKFKRSRTVYGMNWKNVQKSRKKIRKQRCYGFQEISFRENAGLYCRKLHKSDIRIILKHWSSLTKDFQTESLVWKPCFLVKDSEKKDFHHKKGSCDWKETANALSWRRWWHPTPVLFLTNPIDEGAW